MSIPEDSLLDLLVQLKKISSAEVRAVLNPQPQITYSLFQLMVQLDVVDLEALNKTLTSQQPVNATPAAPVQSSSPLVAPAPVVPNQIPGDLLQTKAPALSDQQMPYSQNFPGQPPMVPSQDVQFSSTPNPLLSSVSPELLSTIPDDQKAMLLQVLAMTPAQIEQLPAPERQTFTQLRQAIGLPM